MDRDDVEVNDIQPSLTNTMVIQGYIIVHERTLFCRTTWEIPSFNLGLSCPLGQLIETKDHFILPAYEFSHMKRDKRQQQQSFLQTQYAASYKDCMGVIWRRKATSQFEKPLLLKRG